MRHHPALKVHRWDLAGLGPPPALREVDIAGRTGSLTVIATSGAVDVVGEGRAVH